MSISPHPYVALPPKDINRGNDERAPVPGGPPSEEERGFEALHSIGRGTSILVIGTVLLFLLSFIGRVYTARYLSLAGFGAFNLGLALTGLLSLVALLGLHQATARVLANDPDPAVRRRVIRRVSALTAVAAVVASSIVYFLADPLGDLFGGGSLTQVFQLLSVTVGFSLGCTLLASIFQGFEDAAPNAWFNQVVQPAGFVVFVFLFFHFHWRLNGALWAWSISNAFAFAALLVYTLRRLPKYLPMGGPVASRVPHGMMTLSLSLWGVTTLSYVTAYADTLILGAFRPQAIVGVYSAALTLGRLLLAANGALTYIYLPVTARLQSNRDYESIRSTFVTSTRWILLVTVPLFLLFAALPTDSLTAVYGSAYTTGSLALVIVTTGSLISVAVGPVNACLAGLGMTRWLLLTAILSAGTNTALSFGLIPFYGLNGASIAWTVARVVYPVSGLAGLYVAHKIHPFSRPLLVPLFVTVGVGLPLFWFIGYLGAPVWIVFPLYGVGVLLFLGATFATRSVERGDLVLCRFIEKGLGRRLPILERLLQRFGPVSANPPAP
jgi:O-antigen/teichoic acid export membrane protein